MEIKEIRKMVNLMDKFINEKDPLKDMSDKEMSESEIDYFIFFHNALKQELKYYRLEQFTYHNFREQNYKQCPFIN